MGKPRAMLDGPDAALGRSVRLLREAAPVPLIFARGESQGAFIATVHAQVIVPPEAFAGDAGDRRAPIVGLLTWGQGGASFSAEVDLLNGTCFSLVAADVTMNARFEAADVQPDTRALFANIAAAVVWGDRPARARPTRTLGRVTLADAASHTFAVPAFAYSVGFYMPTSAQYLAAATSTITLHQGPDPTDDPELVVTMGELGTSQLTQEALLLSGNSRFVTFTNHAAAPLTIRPTFALAL
jgi:hypothetical protein